MDTTSINLSSNEIQDFLEQLWAVISDPSNYSIVRWTKGGRVFKVINEVLFYWKLCSNICAGCDEKYFRYFTENCGFQSIPPLERDFHHPDFVEHDISRIKNIQPKKALYNPFDYYDYLLETPNYDAPFELPPPPLSDTFENSESGENAAALGQDTALEIETLKIETLEIETLDTLGSHNGLKETFTLHLGYNSPSEDDSLKSTCSTLVPTPSLDSDISCPTPESLLTDPSEVIPTKNGCEKELTPNLNDCKLEEQASDSSSTLTSGSNSPNLPTSVSPTNLKTSTESSDTDSSDTLSSYNMKDLKSTLELDLVSSDSNEEFANLNSGSNPHI